MDLEIRDLYFKILDFKGENLFESLLKNWVLENNYRNHLSNIANEIDNDKINLSHESNWELYALSRVLDLLTLPFQANKEEDDNSWLDSSLTISEFIEFIKLIGLEISTPESFHSFNCEIINAITGKNNFIISKNYFPALKLKNLIIKRAGVCVSMNPANYNLDLINNAAIYWAFRRRNKRYFDLSHGWGSNSQWRTNLRLDIETNSSFIYNLSGEDDLNNPSEELITNLKTQDLSIQEAIELTKFRQFITSTKEDNDLFPYDFKYEEFKNIHSLS